MAANGIAHEQSAGLMSTRTDVINTAHGKILCVSDIRGRISHLNSLAVQHDASAIIHTGDFGFYDLTSLARISDRTLRHLVQYSNVIGGGLRQQALATKDASGEAIRQQLRSVAESTSGGFALSEFSKLVTGELKLTVPVYTVWGACEDVAILERIRSAPPGPTKVAPSTSEAHTTGPAREPNWSIPNLTVLSEAVTRVLNIGGIRLRLFGLGGAVVGHKLFDNGEGQATIAGGGGTMWTTLLQIGELVDTAQRVYDSSETRLLITHASPGREGLLAQLALVLKADLTISGGLHFRYGVSYNEFSVQYDHENYRQKFLAAKSAFDEIWETVKSQVEQVIDDQQRKYLALALQVTERLPPEASPAGAQGSSQTEEPSWKNSWHWNLPDATFGQLVLAIQEGRISSDMRSQGFNFLYRTQGKLAPSSAISTNAPTPPPHQQGARQGPPPNASSSKPTGPNAPSGPSKPADAQRGPKPPPQQARASPKPTPAANAVDDSNKVGAVSGWDTAPTGDDSAAASTPAPSGGNDGPHRGGRGGRGGGRGRGGDGRGRGGDRGRGRGGPAPNAPATNGA